jgi:hypothetical protein
VQNDHAQDYRLGRFHQSTQVSSASLLRVGSLLNLLSRRVLPATGWTIDGRGVIVGGFTS